jgi:hypothetical protein
MGQIGQSVALEQRTRMMLDVAAGLFRVARLSLDHHLEAGKLLSRHSFSRRLRTLDALQLAMALEFRSFGLLDYFVAADRPFLEVAGLEDLPVLNPEDPDR